ncbi:MAG: lipid-A-disaccharide synthase [Spongiibacteraceae bacterium]
MTQTQTPPLLSSSSTVLPALRVGIVVGEASGDILGAGLMHALRAQSSRPLEFVGIGGPLMLAEGIRSLFDIERLAVMGFVEPLKRLPELLRMRAALRAYFLEWHADIVIGIDAPDFNLGLELWLRERGIRTAHYVSPSVWAWRQGRIHKIRRAVDLMLTLFPFEEQFYRDHDVPVVCVGHPLADQFPLQVDTETARRQLGITAEQRVVALLPGSRGGEIELMLEPFLETAQWLLSRHPDLLFLLPAANAVRYRQLQNLLATNRFPANLLAANLSAGKPLPIRLLEGQSQTAMAAADVILMTSGTTTLEAMLLKKPMVVAYRVGRFTAVLLRWLVKTKFISLPNLVADRALVPEVLQEDVRADVLGPLLLERLGDTVRRDQLAQDFLQLHEQLRRDASARAARAVLELLRVSVA